MYYLRTLSFHDVVRALQRHEPRLALRISHNLCSNAITGGGVTVTRYWKQGAIEYRKIVELKALDLEQYRGASRERRCG